VLPSGGERKADQIAARKSNSRSLRDVSRANELDGMVTTLSFID
jgi:hypothetical protein